jgi:hypothetical protein
LPFQTTAFIRPSLPAASGSKRGVVKWPVRRILAVGLAVVGAAGLGIALWQLLPRDTTTPPPATVGYVYDTTGFESVDAFGGARHEYPARTTISVRTAADGCKVFRWRPFAERFWEWETCGERLVRFAELHQFFGRDDRRTYRCDQGSTLRAGWRCTAQGTTETGRVEPSLSGPGRVVLRTKLAGNTTGDGLRDFWLRPDGVPRRLVVENESTTPSFLGDVHYLEHYVLRLRTEAPSPG